MSPGVLIRCLKCGLSLSMDEPTIVEAFNPVPFTGISATKAGVWLRRRAQF